LEFLKDAHFEQEHDKSEQSKCWSERGAGERTSAKWTVLRMTILSRVSETQESGGTAASKYDLGGLTQGGEDKK